MSVYKPSDDNNKGLNSYSAVSNSYSIVINCMGEIDLSVDFETYNESGREDFYFLYIVQGELEIETSEGWYCAKAGTAAVFYPCRSYRYRNRSGSSIKYYFIHYTGADAEKISIECGFADHVPVEVGVREKLVAGIDSLYKEFFLKQEGYMLKCSGELTSILVSAMRYSQKSDRADFFRSIDHINKKYAEDISITSLAAMEHLSPGRYRTVFASLTGMSPKEYLTKVRIDKGMELLQCTDLSISEISALVGFSDPLYFSRIFRKKNGVSPAEYRKK